MVLDIKLEKMREMICDEAILASVAVFLKRRYEMIFSEMWRFRLAEEDPCAPRLISNRIVIECGNPKQLLEQYHGVRVTNHDTRDSREVLNIAYRELKAGFPVATLLAGEYVPWALKGDEFLMVLIAGIDDASKEMFCLDVHWLHKIASIPLDNFLKGFQYGCSTYSVVRDGQESIDWRSVIGHNTEYLLENNAFQSMRELAGLIKNAFDCKLEAKDGKEAFHFEIAFKIKEIFRTRFLFSYALEYLVRSQNAQALSGYPGSFIELSNQWLSVWSSLNKAFMQNAFDAQRGKIAKKIFDVASEEEKLCNALLQTARGNHKASESILKPGYTAKPDKEINEYIFADISSHMNNEGFSTHMHPDATADLTHTGQFFLTEGLPEEELWNIEGMKFRFPRHRDGRNDNISCDGQTICFPKARYSFIMLLGCAEWGHQSEAMDIHYAGENTVSLQLAISDWSAGDPLFGETVAWEGKCAERKDSEISLIPWFKAHLFAKIIQLNSESELVSIHLPECSNIHIVAITLGK